MQMKDMLSNNPEAAEGEGIDDLLGDIWVNVYRRFIHREIRARTG